MIETGPHLRIAALVQVKPARLHVVASAPSYAAGQTWTVPVTIQAS